MAKYDNLTRDQIQEEKAVLTARFEELKAKKVSLNIARGKPGREQLDLISDMLDVLSEKEQCDIDGMDARNYGALSGLPSAKALFADILGCKPEQCFVGGNASLQLMYDVIAKAYTHGLLHSVRPWAKEEKIKWLCPAPGYDRHFKISQSFGMELITVPMLPSGPDMSLVEELVKDPEVRGMWCVPKYSNPDGYIYSSKVIRRIASLKPAAPDFTVMWDNAYCVHEFDGEYVPFPDMLSVCTECGNPDMVIEFASTSKITFPGSGIAAFACSESNMKYLEGLMSYQIISFDKMNQLRHVLYLKDKAHTLELMKRHAAILKPKFACVLEILDREIEPLGLATWQKPKGGYFVSVSTKPGLAKRTLALCKEAGVVMTTAGATFPYGIDPYDSNIRIAPTLPPVEELREAMEIFCVCLRLAAVEQYLEM